jgi:hypothetical protein
VRLLAAAVPFHLGFFVGTGAILVGLVRWGWGSPVPGTWVLLGLYAAAWLAGTFAVGAPAGAGVREAILVVGLEPALGAVAAATLAVALRVTTVGGDLLMAASGLALRFWLEREERRATKRCDR